MSQKYQKEDQEEKQDLDQEELAKVVAEMNKNQLEKRTLEDGTEVKVKPTTGIIEDEY